MSGATTWRVWLVLAVALIAPVSAAAQQSVWDPDRYLQLVEDGDQLCEEALSIPESDTEAYADAMFTCLRSKEAALEMLRRAVLQNQVGQIDRLWDEANGDLFNLTENVIVLYILLDQCIAADTILQRALREPETLPPGGVGHLESLRPEIQDCNERIASQVPAFDEERYANLIQVAESWRAQAYNRPADDVEGRSANLYEASQNYGEALGLLRQAVVDGVLTGTDEQEELFLLYDELISVLLEMQLCAGAQRRVRQAIADSEAMPEVGDSAAFEARQTEIAECQRALIAANEPREVQRPPDEDEFELRDQAEVGVAPYVLWGVAGASAITALILDITAAGDRDDLDSLRDQCAAGPCDYDRTVQLADDLNGRKVAIAVLGGVAIVTAAVGTVLYFTNRGGSETPPPPAEEPPAEAGIPRFSWDGLGGSVVIPF